MNTRSRWIAVAVLLFTASVVSAQTTYTWNQTDTASFATSTNWTPTRTSPATNDIMVFNNGATTTATGVATQTIGQLSVSGNTNVTLQAGAATQTLTIGGGAGALSVASGSQLNISGTNTLSTSIATGSTGTVSGSMTFTNAAHTILSADASGLTFQNGSSFTAGTGFTGTAFGSTGTANTVIFASGSKYTSLAGSAPFGLGQPSSKVVFQSGSLYSHQQSGTPAFSGRTYADFELKIAGSVTPTGGSPVTMDNLTITQGTMNFGSTSATSAIKKDITVAAGATLNFNPASAGTVNLNGTTAQSITSSGTLAFTSNQAITVNNANGITLNSDITLNGLLTLTSGNITVTSPKTLSISATGSVTHTSGYVIGNLKRTYSATGSKTFDVGTANGYSPVTANVTGGTGDLTVSATQGVQPNVPATTSLLRYWTLAATGITGADLTFQYLAGDVQGSEASYQVIRVTGGTPTYFAPTSLNTGTHTISLNGVTSFPTDWTAGEANTAPNVTAVTVPANGTYVIGQNLDFTATFDKTVLVTGAPRIPITLNTGGTVYADYVSGSNSTALLFRHTVASGEADPDGIAVGASIDANGGTIKNSSGTDAILTLNGVGSTTGVLVDGIRPDVASIVRANSDPTAATQVDFTVTFTKPVDGTTVNTADFQLTSTLTGPTVDLVTPVSSTVYTVTATPGSGTTGTARLDLKSTATITDTVGNTYAGGGFTGGETYTIDRSAPAVSSATRTDPTPTNLAAVHYTVTFTQSVTGVDTTDFQATVTSGGITGQSVTGVSGSGTTYTVTVNSGSGDGTLRLDVLNDGTIKSGTNVTLTGPTFNGEVYTIDKTAPTVSSSNRVGTSPTNAASVQFTVTFSEAVTGTSNSDFALNTTGSVSGASVTGVTGSGATRTVTVNTGSGDGTIRCDVVTGGTIIDAAGNLFNTAFTSGQTYTIDKTAPAVVSINRASTDPSSAATVDFTVTFSEAVTGVAVGGFTITAPALTGTSVAGVSGSGTTYTVTVNTGSGNGSLRLDFNGGGPVIDAAGNSAASFNSGQSYTMTGTPAPPTGLAATPGNAHVALTWDSQDEASSFAVKRATVSGGPYTTLNASVATNSFDDLTASNFTTYYYVVAANGLRGSSANSSEVVATPTGPLTTGNLVVYRVGDGSGTLTSAAAPVFVEERNPTTGAVVQTIPMPTAVNGSNRRLVAAGSSTSEGFLNVSNNGQYIVVTGYDANVATASVAGTSSSTVNRVIGRITMTGSVDTTTALNTFSTGNIRSATSLDGANFWAVGSNTGEIYAGFGANTQTTVANNVTNLRVTNIFGGQLYTSSGSGTTRLATVGAGTPTNSGNTITNLPGFPTSGSPESFFFADLDAGTPGVDTVYVADDGGTIQKYSLVSGSWTANGTLAASTVRGLTGSVSGTTVTLWGTSPSSLYKVTDTAGYNATITGSVSTIATAGTNTAFRGIALLAAAQAVAGNLAGSGAANPSSLQPGDPTTLTVTVTPATTPPSTGITVTVDLTAIGGSAAQTFFDDGTNGDVTIGDNIFTFATSVAPATTGGTKNLPVSIADAQARTATANITLNIVTLVAIHDIQGSGDTSPLVGQTVTTSGIVTGLKSNGYFVEAPQAEWDANTSTSEGIFVFTSSAPPPAAALGNRVNVTATVQEFIPGSDPSSPPVTELVSSTTSVVSTGNPLPPAITITTADTNPAGSIRQLEKYAAMRVHVDSLTVTGPTGGFVNEPNATSTTNGTFYGVITGIPRPFREPGIETPDPVPNPPCCIPVFDANPERIRVASSSLGGSAIDVTAGATVSNLTGPLDYGFRTYTIDPDAAGSPSVSGNVTFTAVPVATATEFTVGCQNLERFFDNVNDSNGAVTLTTTAYNNRLNKASLEIRHVLRNPDILGVEEAETLTGLQNLATKISNDAIAASEPNPNYQAYLLQGNDVGGINVGLLVNPSRVTVNSVAQAAGSLTATYIDPNSGLPALIWDRPPLVLDATVIAPNLNVVVIVNHLRSLSGIDGTDGNRIRTKRRAGAEWLANYVQGRQTANANERIVLVGDFNAFEFNDGYVDVMGTIKGTPTPSTQVVQASSDLVNPDLVDLIDTVAAAQKYSYNFDGNAQAIDHVLINGKAAMNFSRMAYARVDADFPEAYRSDPNRPERFSDHDGEVAYFGYTPTAHYDISIPASVTAGTPFTGTVTVRDGLNNVLTTYTGTVHFTSSDAGATLPVDYTFNGGDAGTHTFTNGFTLFAPGPQSITGTDTLNPSTTGTANTTVICPPLVVTATNNGPICEGGTLQLDVTDTPGATYSWTGPNDFTSVVRNPSISGATPAATGTYNVTVTVGACPYNASTNATVNANPPTPTIAPSGPTAFCAGGTVTLTSSAASGNQWSLNNAPIGGATGQQYVASAAGGYTVTVTDGNGCTATSLPTTVTVFPLPPTPTITPGGPTTFCQGGSVTLSSSAASGNQWNLNGNPIGGATAQTFNATAGGDYTVTVTDGNGCSATSAITSVTVNPIPSTPTITPGGPTTFCAGGSVTLTSSSASGNQWYVNNAPIGGTTAQQYIANAAGDYTVVVTTNGCSSAPSAVTTVNVNPNPNATITAPASVQTGSTGNAASVANAGAGATYNWSITNGTITAGTGTNSITFTAGAVGTLTLNVTVTTSSNCSDSGSANVNVTAVPIPLTVTSVTPHAGKTTGGKSVTIAGTGFVAGATVIFGGSAATSVVVVNSSTITAVTPAHAGGPVNVTVTNPDTSSATLTNGYTYVPTQFDANGDHVIDPSDIFFLVNYLYLGGPAPMGDTGLDSGDANGDGVVDPADIFYLINYLYLHGPAPASQPPGLSTQAVRETVTGSVTLGEPVRRGNKFVVPVIVDSASTEALSLHVTFSGGVRGATIHRTGRSQPVFEISRGSRGALAYLVSYNERVSGVVAELEIEAAGDVTIGIDPAVTLLSNAAGTRKATVAAGTLRVRGTAIGHNARPSRKE